MSPYFCIQMIGAEDAREEQYVADIKAKYVREFAHTEGVNTG